MWRDEDNNIEYWYDTQEVVECYEDIQDAKLSPEEMITCYNTMLATASMLARDMEIEVTMPYFGVRGVAH